MASMLMTEPKPCEFCGRTLRPLTAELLGNPVFGGWEQCDCEQSVADRERRKAEAEEEERRKVQAMRHKRYESAGIPKLFLQNRQGCEQLYAEVRSKATDIVSEVKKGRGAYIVGNVGTHKTLVAATAARYAIDEGIPTVFTRAGKVLDALQETYGTKRSATDVLERYTTAKLLVLDDLGKERPTAWALPKLFDLINERYERMAPTIVTTQYGRADLIRRLASEGDEETAVAIVSRLAEMCGKLEFTGRDARLHG